MIDLIDRNAAINEAYRVIIDGAVFDVVQLETLVVLPTIDAVEVVRCMECKWWDRFPSSSAAPSYHECHYGTVHRHTTAKDYCSYGEQKDDCSEEGRNDGTV